MGAVARLGVRWTVGRRIAALGVLFLIALTVTGGVGVYQAGRSAGETELASQVESALSNTIDTQHTTSVVLADAYRLSFPLAAADRADIVTQMDEHAAELAEHLAALQAVRLPEVQAPLAALLPAIQGVLDVAKQLHGTVDVPPADLLTRTQASWDAFDAASDAVKNLLIEKSARADATARTTATWGRLLPLIAVGITLPLTMLAMWMITRAVADPVRQTMAVLQRVAAGDFTQRIAARADDDLGAMAAAVNATVDRVGKALGTIRLEADTLSTASHHLGDVSSQVTSGAERVTSEAASVAENADSVTSDVRSVAAGSEQMQASIAEIARNAANASEIVTEAVRIARTADVIMARLGTSSAEIEEVARVITAIADQTNLLALNATIEAARAGEAGKGFAVVASEVKELAQETARATQGIGTRIEAIQADSADAVAALHQISDTINRVQEIQETIAGAVEEQASSTQEISSSVHRIAGHTGDIAGRIGTVTAASQEALMAATLTRSAAGELAATADNLQGIVAQFTVPTVTAG